MADNKAYEAVEHGIRLWWQAIGRTRGQSLHAGAHYSWVLSENRTGAERIFNVTLPEGDGGNAMDELVEGMRAGTLPGGMILTPASTPADAAHRLAMKGLAIDESAPCMALCLAAFAPAPALDGCRVVPVEDETALGLWVAVIHGSLFGPGLFTIEQYQDFFRMDNVRLYLAFLGDVPASACMAVREGADATLECVGTLPAFRRRGAGSAAVSRALTDLKPYGVQTVTLRSEPDAIVLYHRLGFTDVCKRTVASVQR